MEEEHLKTDLRLVFNSFGEADLSADSNDLETVSGRDNLVQALTMRLLIYRGELANLGHPRYGSRIRDFIGQPMDSANLELLRRYARKTILEDPRVEEITTITVRARQDIPGAVDLQATVTPVSGEEVQLEVTLDVG